MNFDFEDFPRRTFDKVRYADTDRQGHVNNTAFSSFFETGRVDAGTGVTRVGTSSVHFYQALLSELTLPEAGP